MGTCEVEKTSLIEKRISTTSFHFDVGDVIE